jgi:hypothetical protein
MQFAGDRPYADPEAAARKLIEICNTIEAVQDGRLHIEKVNGPFLQAGGSPRRIWRRAREGNLQGLAV